MRKALYAGTFDPFTCGHLWIVTESLKQFDEVHIVVAVNPNKKCTFDLNTRLFLIKNEFINDARVKVYVLENDYVAELAKRENIHYLIRGLRNSQDFEFEKTVLRLNQTINESIQCVYLMPPANLNEISSSNVKSLVGFPGWKMITEGMVPELVNQHFQINLYSKEIRPFWDNLLIISEHWWDKIIKSYSESHRYYHTLEHVLDLLRQTKTLHLNLFEDQVLTLSILFHDLVYNPKEANNEELSAYQFNQFAQGVSLHPEITKKVNEFILATKNHINKNDDALLNLFLDLDLSILGSDPIRFNRYEKEIRKEFNFVPENLYEEARHKIMNKLSENTFKSEWGIKNFKRQAIYNLKKYL